MNKREIDTKVAKAMGLCPHIYEYYEPEKTYCETCGFQLTGFIDDDYPHIRCKLCGKKVRGLRYSVGGQPDCLYYTTDISAAWLVVEWMRERGWDWGMKHIQGTQADVWFCRPEWWTEDLYRAIELPRGQADDVPLAICLAFLRAMGVEMEGEG